MTIDRTILFILKDNTVNSALLYIIRSDLKVPLVTLAAEFLRWCRHGLSG